MRTGTGATGVVMAACLLAGCAQAIQKPSAGDAAGDGSAAPDSAAFRQVTLERTPCFGACPVYRVTIRADGRVAYEGEQWVEVDGTREGRADPEWLARLEKMLAGFAVDPGQYQYGKPACGQFMTDMPGARITIVRRSGNEQRYSYNEGCTATPDRLKRLAELIDRAARTGRWIDRPTPQERMPAPRQQSGGAPALNRRN